MHSDIFDPTAAQLPPDSGTSDLASDKFGNARAAERSHSTADVESYLRGYLFCHRLLNLKKHEQKYIDTIEWEKSIPAELSLARAKMFEIRHFVLGLPNSDEKMLLYFHYIRGDSVEKCGLAMNISRSTAFRLKRRALDMALQHSIQTSHSLRLF